MKSYLLIIILASASFVHVQAQSTLIGKWKVDLAKTIQTMSSQQKLRYDSLPVRTKENIIRSFQNRTFQFINDQSVVIVSVINGNAKQISGQWSYESAPRKLSLILDGVTHEYRIETDSENSIRLIHQQQNERSLLRMLCLTRIN